jgi:hypothetical protein
MPRRFATLSVPGATGFLDVRAGDAIAISLTGTWTGLVVPRRSLDGGATWGDVPNPDGSIGWTANTEVSYFADASEMLLVEARTVSSGSVHLILSTDRVEQSWQVRPAVARLFGGGAFTALGAAAALLLMFFLAMPAHAQMLCDEVAGRGRVCPITTTFQRGFALKPTTISGLPTCSASLSGTFAAITNGADSRSSGDAVSATGSGKVLVFCDGGAFRYIW